ncbi:hypothetical protein TREMEDRAFT_63633 [Tremella mesenterica DSM 1558]|uniref:uncharacterized protein n=1 Tax=Tremella mesenterica (strain ATCC 24925 / CBS 8224 / DSM 1558 / NBRC 9311 / NRRL Y-6157 / RJB 2259-6 / UBC 559-6) TaxID=578456 RepID=UPI0003F49256|nr:uncharacterized protein TREMEDRAFT_63633 [Tremella mesenterica DSM 1558]EIW68466.1 hypothetical protein TREMEDRAFT_63633 [Tremella mesenterica DSM 1558]
MPSRRSKNNSGGPQKIDSLPIRSRPSGHNATHTSHSPQGTSLSPIDPKLHDYAKLINKLPEYQSQQYSSSNRALIGDYNPQTSQETNTATEGNYDPTSSEDFSTIQEQTPPISLKMSPYQDPISVSKDYQTYLDPTDTLTFPCVSCGISMYRADDISIWPYGRYCSVECQGESYNVKFSEWNQVTKLTKPQMLSLDPDENNWMESCDCGIIMYKSRIEKIWPNQPFCSDVCSDTWGQ